MPEFVMEDRDNPDFQELDDFTQGYIEALFFTETSAIPMAEWFAEESQERIREGQADGNIPADVGFGDLHPEALDAIAVDCVTFEIENAKALKAAYNEGYTERQAGTDFWFTRNGHGTGYWDRQLGEIGDHLTDATRKWCEVNPFFADIPEPESPTGIGYVYYNY
jgi:hypothetical protein